MFNVDEIDGRGAPNILIIKKGYREQQKLRNTDIVDPISLPMEQVTCLGGLKMVRRLVCYEALFARLLKINLRSEDIMA